MPSSEPFSGPPWIAVDYRRRARTHPRPSRRYALSNDTLRGPRRLRRSLRRCAANRLEHFGFVRWDPDQLLETRTRSGFMLVVDPIHRQFEDRSIGRSEDQYWFVQWRPDGYSVPKLRHFMWVFRKPCHASLPKIHENGVATKVGDIYTRGKYLTHTR